METAWDYAGALIRRVRACQAHHHVCVPERSAHPAPQIARPPPAPGTRVSPTSLSPLRPVSACARHSRALRGRGASTVGRARTAARLLQLLRLAAGAQGGAPVVRGRPRNRCGGGTGGAASLSLEAATSANKNAILGTQGVVRRLPGVLRLATGARVQAAALAGTLAARGGLDILLAENAGSGLRAPSGG